MAVSTKISQSSLCFLLGVLGFTGTQSVACSSKFSSCYEHRNCPEQPDDEAGSAGDESDGSSGTAGRATADAVRCIGSGTCTVPVVKCGAVDCAIGSKVCCFRRAGSTTNQTCDDVVDCPETAPDSEPSRTPTECDQHEDCGTGYLCSRVSASGGSYTYCRPAAEANSQTSTANWYEVCESPVKASLCSGGRTCSVTDPAFPGWKFCAHSATD